MLSDRIGRSTKPRLKLHRSSDRLQVL